MTQVYNKGQLCIDTTAAFTTTHRFDTREAVVTWAREVGIRNKVIVTITRSDIATGKRGRSDKLILGCDKGGRYKQAESSTQSASKKCGCPFKIRSTPLKDGLGWKVEVKCGVHNHGLPDRLEGHAFVGRLSADEQKHVKDLTKRHVPPRHILLSLQEKNPENVTRITQIYKKKSMLEKEVRGPRTEIQHLLKLIEDANYVSWSRRKDDSDVMRDICWAHPDSVKLLNMFPIVLIMDNTYKTNKHKLPLLEIVGMTSTELTFAVAFAYMESERKENFCWVLEKLKEMFIKEGLFPQVILTDRDLALMNAIEVVFPDTVNLLCRFHIDKNVGAKCKQYVLKDMQESVMEMWKDIVWSPNEVEYQKLEQACIGCTIFVDYVKETWLNPHRQRFVAAWINRVMHLGNTTTNRVESAHWKLKQMLEHSKGDLCKCWEGMHDNIRLQLGKIIASFQKSFNEVEHAHTSPFYEKLRGFVSRASLRRIAQEFERVGYVETDKSVCGCTLRRTYGLPCACELGRYKISGLHIPLDSVHIQWRKLSMEGQQEEGTKAGSELDMTDAMEELWKRFRSPDIVGKRILKSKVLELAYPSTSSMIPPPDKVKTKGGVKKDKRKVPKGYDVYRNPSYWEHVDNEYCDSQGSLKRLCTQSSQPSQKQLSQKQSSQPSQKQPTQKQSSQKQSSHPYQKREFESLLVQFPKHIHPYVDEIVNVHPDGNCGFRVIASLLGYSEEGWSIVRRELDNEMRANMSFYEKLFGNRLQEVRDSLKISGLGPQPRERWMTIPQMGYVIANRYNVILVSLGHPSKTLFPMMTSHSTTTKIFCIGYVNQDHWVQVNMKQGFPLPEVTADWKKFCLPEATSWMVAFAGRMQQWQYLTPVVPQSTSVIEL